MEVFDLFTCQRDKWGIPYLTYLLLMQLWVDTYPISNLWWQSDQYTIWKHPKGCFLLKILSVSISILFFCFAEQNQAYWSFF